jgi:hypothetical protein
MPIDKYFELSFWHNSEKNILKIEYKKSTAIPHSAFSGALVGFNSITFHYL